jgi:tRNA(Ile)-lysidine synthase
MPDHALSRAILDAGLPAGSRLLVAVSGGPDSTALLHVLSTLASDRSWQLRVAHVNHHMRDGADADQDFVQRLAAELSLPFDAVSVDARAYSAEQHLSPEAGARALRYNALFQILTAWPGDLVVTGHTRDDQAETILIRLLRGTGLTGLGAMRLRSGSVVRPFLTMPRRTLTDYLHARNLPYRSDPSNLDLRYHRNRIRHEIIPGLERDFPGARNRLARTAALLQVDGAYLAAETAAAVEGTAGPLGVGLLVWRTLHPALRRSTLRHLIESATGRPADVAATTLLDMERRLLELDPTKTYTMPVSKETSLRVQEAQVFVGVAEALLSSWTEQMVAVPGETSSPVGRMSAGTIEVGRDATTAHLLAVLGPWHALFDESSLDRGPTLRTRRPGDRMRPLGSPGSRKVQDIMVDRKIPAGLRGVWPLVVAGEEILWIPGVARADTGRLTPEARSVVHLRFRPIFILHRGTIPRHFR